MASRLYIDFETRSACDLKAHGLFVYAEHPSTQILMMGFAFDDEPVSVSVGIVPQRVIDHCAEGGEVFAHNSQFERVMWNSCFLDCKPLTIDQMHCTAAMAYAMSLPGSLEKAAAALGIKNQKDMAGKKLMMKMSRPKADGSWCEDSEDLDRLAAYCKQDVEVQRELAKRLIKLSKSERHVWCLDQQINDRGIQVDIESINLAISVAEQETKRLDQEMQKVTQGFISTCNQISGFKNWLSHEGVEVDSIGKDRVKELRELPWEENSKVKRALELRAEAGKSSVKKLYAMRDRATKDRRVKGTLQFCGSHTGRWAGRGIQPQNFPKGKLSVEEVTDVMTMLRSPDPVESISLFYGSPLRVLSNCLRSFIIAKEGSTLLFGDYTSIEAMTLAWLAGEKSVLSVFERGDDIYIDTYARSFGVPYNKVTEEQRGIGKVQVLAFGYGGGKRAAQKFAPQFSDETAEHLKVAWREANPAIVSYWHKLQAAAIYAVRFNGEKASAKMPFGHEVVFKTNGSFLFCKLPSGRVLTYPYPQISLDEKKREMLTYKGEYADGGWGEQKLYGGLLAENITQAVARDILVHGMEKLTDAGFHIVFTSHDEIVCEESDGEPIMCDGVGLTRSAAMKAFMCELPTWAKGLPLSAKIKQGKRYSK